MAIKTYTDKKVTYGSIKTNYTVEVNRCDLNNSKTI